MLTYGFYSSLDGDRKYNANQMNGILDGIIGSGVFVDIGDSLKVTPSSGMTLSVGTGKAWFNKTWTENDSLLPITLDPSEIALDRIDAIVLEVNTNDSVRANSIKVIKGNPSSTPEKPTLTNGGNVYQHALAYVTVAQNTSAITSENIEIVVGTEECPYISSLSGDSLPIQNTPPTNPAIKAYIDTSIESGGGTFNDLYVQEVKTVPIDTLTTTDKTVAGAINEVNGNKTFGTRVPLNFDSDYITQREGYVRIHCGYQSLMDMGSFTIYINSIDMGNWTPSTMNSLGFAFYVPKGMTVQVKKGSGISADCSVSFYPINKA